MSLEQHIEGVLFYKAEPMKKAALAELFSVSNEELTAALHGLKERLESGATRGRRRRPAHNSRPAGAGH